MLNRVTLHVSIVAIFAAHAVTLLAAIAGMQRGIWIVERL